LTTQIIITSIRFNVAAKDNVTLSQALKVPSPLYASHI